MEETLKSFKDYLAANNLKLTQQRLLIFKVFMSTNDSMSSENILHTVQKMDACISRSTVYRTVKHLHHSGVARCSHHTDGSARYEPVGSHSSRIICEQCGKTIPLQNPYIDCLQRETARQQGFTLNRHHTVLYGICNECNSMKRNQENSGLEKEKASANGKGLKFLYKTV